MTAPTVTGDPGPGELLRDRPDGRRRTTRATSSGSTSRARSTCAHCGVSYRELEAAGLRLAVSEVSVRYRQPARFDDLAPGPLLGAGARVSRRVEFGYAVEHAEDGRLLATAVGRAARARRLDGARAGCPTTSGRLLVRCPIRSGWDSPQRRRGHRVTNRDAIGRLIALPRGLCASRGLLCCRASLAGAPPLAAQEQSVVEQLAPRARRRGRARVPARSVPARARGARLARAPGRRPRRRPDRRPRATPLLLPLLSDPDSTVRVAAAFALGLLRDTRGGPAAHRPADRPARARRAHRRRGGHRAGQDRRPRGAATSSAASWAAGSRCRRRTATPAFNQVLLESWRLGRDAPVTGPAPLHGRHSCRAAAPRRLLARAVSGRPPAGNRLLARPPRPRRPTSARSRPGRSPAATRRRRAWRPRPWRTCWLRAADDPSPQVRINAIRSLAGYEDSALATKLVPLLDDPLAEHPGPGRRDARRAGRCARRCAALARVAGGKGTFALRRTALVALGARRLGRLRPGGRRAGARARTGATAPRPRRAAALAGPGAVAGVPGRSRRPGRRRRTPGLGGRGRRARIRRCSRPRGRLLAHRRRGRAERGRRCRRPGGRPGGSAGAGPACTAPPAATPSRRPRSRRWTPSSPSGRPGPPAQARVDREFLLGAGRPDELSPPALGRGQLARGGRSLGSRPTRSPPVASLQDYRDLVAPLSDRARLAGPAPRDHRDRAARADRDRAARARRAAHRGQLPSPGRPPLLRPQPLAPRGAQFRGPGRRPARRRVRRPRRRHPGRDQPQPVRRADARHGALRAPTPGSSQWFINLSPQPHLDGTYTVFGKVVGGHGHPDPDHAGRCDPDDRRK